MEKVKLPKEICKILDNAGSYKLDDHFLWNAIQWDSTKMFADEKYKLNRFANARGTLKLAKAILHGYEPEETEEERKENEIKDKMLDFIKTKAHLPNLYNDYVNELYNIAHGKK